MSAPSTPRRVVAIVGRPNVGKSALFNRLVGRRVSIVHPESGVTRDRVMQEAAWGDERFDLVDTGGIGVVDRAAGCDAIENAMHRQVDLALQDAAAAILVADVTTGLTPMDVEVARRLRASDRPAAVAVNKCDEPGRDAGADEFQRLGFPVFPVSATHNRGLDPLVAWLAAHLPPAADAVRAAPLAVAVVGRPNVGKSSYINRLLRADRVIVSAVPGTTRDSIDIPFSVGAGPQARHYLLIDTAGLRRPNRIDTAVERFSRMRTEESIRRAAVVALVLDAVQRPTAQDREIAALINRHEKGCVLIVNKWDLEETTQRAYGPEISRLMPFMAHCPVVFVSSKTGYNIRRSVEAIDHVGAQVSARLPTGVLNRAVMDACARTSPPAAHGRTAKIYYATQSGVAPLRIQVFVNDPRLVREPYRQYLVRSLRERFGLEGAPVVLQLRSSHARRERTDAARVSQG